MQSIRRAAADESVMSPQMGGKLADAMRAPAKSDAADSVKLSSREKEIILKLARRDSNKEIASEPDLSEPIVKIHVQGILRKLNLASRVQAAVYAVEHGLVVER